MSPVVHSPPRRSGFQARRTRRPAHGSGASCYVADVSDGAVTGFHHLALTVRDLDVSAAWYERLFDLDPVMDEPGNERRAKVYRLRGTTELLGLVEHSGNDGSEFRFDRTGLDHAAFAVATRADVDHWARRLDAAGITHSGRIDIPTGAILNFADPDGIALSIFYEGD